MIERNLVNNSFAGILLSDNKNVIINKLITIKENTIINNEIGISITDKFSPNIINNNIYENNESIKLSLFASRDVNATNNWWGTTDKTVIDQKIYDFYDDFNLGKVNYVPFLTAPNPYATPDQNGQSLPDSTPPTDKQNPDNSVPKNNGILAFDWLQIATLVILGVVFGVVISVLVRKRKC